MESIRVTGLKKYYKQVKAVDGISFSVSQGEVFGMLGPNGAGKTTTVETIVGLVPRDGGDIRVGGLDPERNALAVKSRIGVQLQTAAMFPRLTVRETVSLYARFYPRALDVAEVVALVGLTEKANTQTLKLSGGQLQRLSVALALVSNGAVIFLDEPTTGLDPQARRSLWEVVRQMRQRGKTVFMTTHYMEEAEKLCDRVAVIDRGKVIALDSPAALIKKYFPEKAIEFQSAGAACDPNFKGLSGVKRVKQKEATVILYTAEVPATLAALIAYAEMAGFPLDDVSVRTATLEDVFLELTGRGLRE